MKIKSIYLLLLITSAIILLIALTSRDKEQVYATTSYNNNNTSNIPQNISSQRIKQKLSQMTLHEKVAQMVVSSVVPENLTEGSTEYKKIKRLCEQNKIGGFIFFKGSASDYAWLSNKLQSSSETPLLISADFERGTGMRVTDGSLFPNNMAIGAGGNADLAYKMGLLIAKESRLIGVCQNYAPVCDVNNNPNNPIINVRSFGEDPQLVSKMSAAMIKGLQDGKVIATAKHFPGHGDTDVDSHNDLPVLNFDMNRMNSIELVPFKNAIDNKVMSVMIAHLSFPELESAPKIPSSLSRNIVNELLINQLGFNGLVVTDALNMKGITKYFSTSEVALMCVNAGIDLILMPINEEVTINAIVKAVNSGQISEERINQSAEKILKTKEWLGLFDNKFVDESKVASNINTDESKQLAQQIADESITLVKDDNNILPLKDLTKSTGLITLSDGKESYNFDILKNTYQEKFPNLLMANFTEEISRGNFSAALDQAKEFDYIIVAIYAKVRFGTGKIRILPSHVEFLNSLKELNKNLVVISYGNPYLLSEFSNIPSYICAYGDSNPAIIAGLKAITGQTKFKGKLPVSIIENYKYGSGILK